MVFYTQITMEAAEDNEFLEAMRAAHMGALVGVEAVTPEGLKAVFKDFNSSGEKLVQRLLDFQRIRHSRSGVLHLWSSDRPAGYFHATAGNGQEAGLTFAQFVMMTPFPGTVDFERWEKAVAECAATVDGIPITRYWLIPPDRGRRCSCRTRQ